MTTLLVPKEEHVLPNVSDLKFDEKKHTYSLNGKLLSGVTTVISKTSAKDNLIGWAANMAVDYIKENSKLVEGQFVRLVQELTLEEARKAYAKRRDKAATKGTDTHGIVEAWVTECLEQNAGEPIEMMMEKFAPIRPFVEWAIGNVDRFLAAEQRLYSETYGFAGTCDFVAIIDGKLTIGDLKTFPKMWSADAFIQMGAYSICWEELTGTRPEQSVVVKMCDPKDERIKKYGGKAFAAYPRYALVEDEEMFLTRLKMYRYNENFVSPKE